MKSFKILILAVILFPVSIIASQIDSTKSVTFNSEDTLINTSLDSLTHIRNNNAKHTTRLSSLNEEILATKNVMHIIFFIIISVITILTYINARRTILQPLRTEVIKEQVSIFRNLIDFMDDKKNFDHFNLIMLTVVNFFHNFDQAKPIINKEPTFNSLYLSKRGSRPTDWASRLEGHEIRKLKSGSSLIFDKDGKMILSSLELGENDFEVSRKINELTKNPLLPKRVKELVQQSKEIYDKSIMEFLPEILESIFNPIISELETGYDVETKDIMMCSINASNAYIKKRTKHEGKIDDLRTEIKNYLKIDDLFNK